MLSPLRLTGDIILFYFSLDFFSLCHLSYSRRRDFINLKIRSYKERSIELLYKEILLCKKLLY